MATKITKDDIYNINCAYLRLGTYAATARELGFSASTVKKYIIPNFQPALEKKEFSSEIKPISEITINWSLSLSAEEIEEIKELQKEIIM